jgi:phosphatidylglycerol:prolipoprotein diacylglycerol transferase
MLSSEPYIWSGSRYFIRSEEFNFAYYGLFYLFSFIICYIVILKDKKSVLKDWETKLNFIVSISLFAIVFGRLGFILFYPNSVNRFIEIFQTWKGGISSHGSLIGLLSLCVVMRKYYEASFRNTFDSIMTLSVISGFWVRLSNFVNSEKIGSYTNGATGVIFVNNQSVHDYLLPKHPIQLYEATACVVLAAFALRFKVSFRSGYLACFILVTLFTFRFVSNYFFGANVLLIEQQLNIVTIIFGLSLFWIINRNYSGV